ncbi:sensor histidine kinase [Actinomadura rupiterrae]|uniref:sensor histidine kinase n=1 Tax=Actinomadura rupiterrae TaxID=559627 RepID=UPI0020A61265|nr:HAMP domain-containing sensor histidine kinase [Actinomadura rupiterrae]MCP2336169.1 signal transduction histidine kinase [Actinomadura rupiterrae]
MGEQGGRGDRLRRWAVRALFSVRGRATVITVVMSGTLLLLCTVLAVQLLVGAGRYSARQHAYGTLQRVVYDITTRRVAMPVDPRPDEASLIQIVEPDGRVVAASPDLAGDPPLNPVRLRQAELLIGKTTCPRFLPSCVQLVGLRVGGPKYPRTAIVYVAEPVAEPLRTPWLYLEAVAAMLALLAFMAWWTWRTIGSAFRPVWDIRRRLAEITSARGLDMRVPEPTTGGELQMLARTINETLERLEKATNRERRFVSEASHDLRNPIAGLHTRLEVALDEPDDTDWKPLVRGALGDAERLNDIVVDLLELSRLDARSHASVEPVDLAELAHREIATRPWRVPVTTRMDEGVVVRANTTRLGRVLGNLLSNAERHAENVIEVIVEADGDQAVLEVRDDGSGIPPEARERVFERFARLAESKRRDPAGTGLGLPIAREIARIYGGDLKAADSPRGARLVMRLPLAPAEPPPEEPPPAEQSTGDQPPA